MTTTAPIGPLTLALVILAYLKSPLRFSSLPDYKPATTGSLVTEVSQVC